MKSQEYYKVLKYGVTKLGNPIELIGTPHSSLHSCLIIGVFHGDEPQGKYLIEEYLKQTILPSSKSCKPAEDAECSHISLNAGEAISKRGMLFIPCLNPDGLRLERRTNANGVDLNRNFPTKNWGQNLGDNATCDDENSGYYGGKSAGSEIETQFLIDTIDEFKPEIILTLHAPYKVVNYDGPAKKIAEKISKIINYPAEASIGYPTPGSFGTYAGVERNIPTITLELDETCPIKDLLKPVHKIFEEVKRTVL